MWLDCQAENRVRNGYQQSGGGEWDGNERISPLYIVHCYYRKLDSCNSPLPSIIQAKTMHNLTLLNIYHKGKSVSKAQPIFSFRMQPAQSKRSPSLATISGGPVHKQIVQRQQNLASLLQLQREDTMLKEEETHNEEKRKDKAEFVQDYIRHVRTTMMKQMKEIKGKGKQYLGKRNNSQYYHYQEGNTFKLYQKNNYQSQSRGGDKLNTGNNSPYKSQLIKHQDNQPAPTQFKQIHKKFNKTLAQKTLNLLSKTTLDEGKFALRASKLPIIVRFKQKEERRRELLQNNPRRITLLNGYENDARSKKIPEPLVPWDTTSQDSSSPI